MDIKLGPEMLETLPWVSLLAIALMLTVFAVVRVIIQHSRDIAESIAIVIKAWKNKGDKS